MPTIKVKGMSCQHCVASVTKALKAIDGVTDAKVDLAKAEASYESSMEIQPDVIKDAIKKIGFDPE